MLYRVTEGRNAGQNRTRKDIMWLLLYFCWTRWTIHSCSGLEEEDKRVSVASKTTQRKGLRVFKDKTKTLKGKSHHLLKVTKNYKRKWPTNFWLVTTTSWTPSQAFGLSFLTVCSDGRNQVCFSGLWWFTVCIYSTHVFKSVSVAVQRVWYLRAKQCNERMTTKGFSVQIQSVSSLFCQHQRQTGCE